jgi:FMN phosphatase YigB (HAD superfamily)
MVGDTLNADILGAQQLGMMDVWITRRANTRTNREELSQIQPTWKIDTLSELPPLLRVINST